MGETTPPKASGGKKVSLGRIALVVSLALNLVVVGLVVGTFLGRGSGEEFRPDRVVRELGFGPYGAALNADQVAKLRGEVSDRRSVLRKGRKDLRKGLRDSVELLRQEPFDPAKFEKTLMVQAETAASLQEIGRKTLLEQVSAMTMQERAEFADRLERHLKRRRPPRPRKKD